MKVDYLLPAVPLSTGRSLARRAARLGYRGLFTADTSHDPFLPLAVAAEAAPELELGTAIAVAFARSPMTTAMTAWDLAELSGGRFMLGLGTQVKAHVTRRFSMPWGSPGPRLREYILALRAIWKAWQEGAPLRFRGDFYQLTLMTPFFDPGPISHPHVPVFIAGVGPYMCRLAGELCDGFHVHPFHTARYLDEVVLPRMAEGAAAAGRSLDNVERAVGAFVVTGRNADEMAAARAYVRQQIAFYASTPAYRGVLELHDWDFGEKLTAMSKRGEWEAMGGVVPDEVVDEVAVVAPLDELGAALRERYEGRVQRLAFYAIEGMLQLSEEEWIGLVADTAG